MKCINVRGLKPIEGCYEARTYIYNYYCKALEASICIGQSIISALYTPQGAIHIYMSYKVEIENVRKVLEHITIPLASFIHNHRWSMRLMVSS